MVVEPARNEGIIFFRCVDSIGAFVYIRHQKFGHFLNCRGLWRSYNRPSNIPFAVRLCTPAEATNKYNFVKVLHSTFFQIKLYRQTVCVFQPRYHVSKINFRFIRKTFDGSFITLFSSSITRISSEVLEKIPVERTGL